MFCSFFSNTILDVVLFRAVTNLVLAKINNVNSDPYFNVNTLVDKTYEPLLFSTITARNRFAVARVNLRECKVY